MNPINLIEASRSYNIHPNRNLGQNFVRSKAIIDNIIRASNIERDDNILEIGAGLGALTYRLIEKAGSVTAIEIDSGLNKFLRQMFEDREGLQILHADFLKVNLDDLFTKSVSNLPYYCSSEILFRIAVGYSIQDVYVMLQREMAERITSQVGKKSYGALTITLSLYYKPSILLEVDRRSFYPQPEVNSSFIRLKRRRNLGLEKEEIDLFHRLVKSAFWGRRKTMIKALAESPHMQLDKALVRDVLKSTDIREKIRGEDLGIEDYKELTQRLYKELRLYDSQNIGI